MTLIFNGNTIIGTPEEIKAFLDLQQTTRFSSAPDHNFPTYYYNNIPTTNPTTTGVDFKIT